MITEEDLIEQTGFKSFRAFRKNVQNVNWSVMDPDNKTEFKFLKDKAISQIDLEMTMDEYDEWRERDVLAERAEARNALNS